MSNYEIVFYNQEECAFWRRVYLVEIQRAERPASVRHREAVEAADEAVFSFRLRMPPEDEEAVA